MSTEDSIKTYRAVIELRAYGFNAAYEELERDGYIVKSLEEEGAWK